MKLLLLFLLCAPLAAAQQTRKDDFALQDGDTVVFFGDSNTEWGSYPGVIENYTLLRYPERHIEFINAGLDGDMASKAFFRLDRDVFARGATVAVVMFGINDISWGNYAGPEFQKTFIDYTLKIVDAARKKNVRVYVTSYPITGAPYGARAKDEYLLPVSALTATDTSSLQRLGDEVMRLARQHGALTIDVQREMRRIRETAPLTTKLHLEDGVHLNELGNEVLAYVLLKGLGASESHHAIELDTRADPVQIAANGATITDVRKSGDELQFTVLDNALPLTFWAPVDSSQFSIENVFAPINSYQLRVTGLKGKYEIQADSIPLSLKCGFTGKRLSEGINLAGLASDRWFQRGPWAQQAMALARLTEAKAELYRGFFYPLITEVDGPNWTAMRREAKAAIERTSAAQRQIARPRPYRISIRPFTGNGGGGCKQR